MAEQELLAGRRDATFLASPGRAEVAHVAVEDRGGWFAACAPGRHLRGRRCILLVEETLREAVTVHPNGRCRQPGCRVRWPAEYRDPQIIHTDGGNARRACIVTENRSPDHDRAHQEET
jgi:hypothetical protein